MDTAQQLNIPHHDGGAIVCIEGPRYSSRAESLVFRQWGARVINMTCVPEVVLAAELGLPFQTVALSTDYDCWRDDHEAVSVDLVDRTLKQNAANATRLFVEAVKALGRQQDALLAEYLAAQVGHLPRLYARRPWPRPPSCRCSTDRGRLQPSHSNLIKE